MENKNLLLMSATSGTKKKKHLRWQGGGVGGGGPKNVDFAEKKHTLLCKITFLKGWTQQYFVSLYSKTTII